MQMVNKKTYKKFLVLLIIGIFTMVNLSIVSSVVCSMKDMSDCCCKHKTETKSCCANKKEVKLVRHCACEMKEANTDPAEVQTIFHSKSGSNELKIFNTEKNFDGKENDKFFSDFKAVTHHILPHKDINTFKCVLRI